MSLNMSPADYWALAMGQRVALIRAHNKRNKKG